MTISIAKAVPAARNFIRAHKTASVIVALAVALGAYAAVRAIQSGATETRYVLAAVGKGTVVTTVSGSGQVSASDQVDVKAKASGDVLRIYPAEGDFVKAGAIIAQIDATDALKAVRDAQMNLQNEQLVLQKLKGPDGLAVPRNKADAEDALAQAYGDSFNAVANAFLDLPNIMTGLNNTLLGYDFGASQWNIDYYTNAVQKYDMSVRQYRDDAYEKYLTARTAYDASFAAYKATNRSSATSTIVSLLNDTYATTVDIAEALKSANNLIQFYEDQLNEHNIKPSSTADAQLATVNAYTAKITTAFTNLQNMQTAVKNDEYAVQNADIDLASEELALQQRQNALADAQANLANYSVRAPFDGVVAKINVKLSDSVGSGTAVSTMVTQQKLAVISLNEVDAAKIQVGQKVTLTFDAIDGLTIAGEIVQIDSIGTVTQGVVTYNVTIKFDTQDDRVKPGMSVNASIVTNVKQDVLTVPNGAIKTQNGVSYVQMFDAAVPQNQMSQGFVSKTSPNPYQVTTGLSNDTVTEIVSGLKEGDQVVVRTVNGTTSKMNTTQAPSLFGGGGGTFRVRAN